jgi:uncharacterized repeat protein (TIGR03943 family)
MKKIQSEYIPAFFLLLWSISVFRVWLNGDLSKLIHPRFVPVTVGAAALSVCIAAAIMLRRKNRGHSHSVIGVAVLALTLVVSFGFRPSATDASDELPEESVFTGASNVSDGGVPAFVLEERSKNIIELSDVSFFPVISDIYNNTALYAGKTLRLTGMFLRKQHPDDPEDCGIARMMMVCCAADLSPVGLACRYSGAKDLVHRSWYTVEGEISEGGKDRLPVLSVRRISPAAKPVHEYVYPL